MRGRTHTTKFASINYCSDNTCNRPGLHSLAPAGSTWLSKRLAIADTRFENAGADMQHLLAPLQFWTRTGSEGVSDTEFFFVVFRGFKKRTAPPWLQIPWSLQNAPPPMFPTPY